MNDEQRAEAILREVSRRVEREVRRQANLQSKPRACLLLARSSRGRGRGHANTGGPPAASGLTPENLVTLKRYRRIYEVAQLVLVEYCSRPEGLTPAALENFFKVTEDT